MGVRKQRRELLLRLEGVRDEFLAAQAAILIAVIRSPWDETRRGPELREWQRRRHEVLDPLCERAAALEKELFVGFAELAKINPSRTKDFVDKMSRLVVEAKHDGFMRRGKPYHKQPPALIEAELALRRALAAVKALTEREQYAIGAALFFRGWHDHRVREWVPVDSCDWVENLSDIALAACAAVGIGSQAPADPLSANHKDWPLLNFIRQLYRLSVEFGGDLNYSRKNGVGLGPMMTALNFLKPLLPDGILDNPPYAAIENLINDEKREPGKYVEPMPQGFPQ